MKMTVKLGLARRGCRTLGLGWHFDIAAINAASGRHLHKGFTRFDETQISVRVLPPLLSHFLNRRHLLAILGWLFAARH